MPSKHPKRRPARAAPAPAGEPVFTISVVARLCRLPVYTIRWLETHELLHPARTDGNQRLFTQEEVDLLQDISTLLRRRVNLAGIRVILLLRQEYRFARLVVDDDE